MAQVLCELSASQCVVVRAVSARLVDWQLLPLALAFSLLPGCGPGKPATAHVTGKVTLDGQPIEKGTIMFASASGKVDPVYAEIINGEFSADVPHGEVAAIPAAFKETGKMTQSYSTQKKEVINLIPNKYAGGIPITVSGKELKKDLELVSK